MLTAVHGNRLEDLADRLMELLAADPPPPLVPDIVVVQSAGMARWLSLRVAQSLGIAANLRFPLPAEFLWTTFRALVPGVPDASPFEPRLAVWHLRAILDQLEDTARFQEVHDYLREADERGRHELAARIADLFDQYLVYRPRWITDWEAGADAEWQAELWRRLVARTAEPHRVRVQEAALRALTAGPPAGLLPARVAVFGIPTMPPAYLEALRGLAAHTDVWVFRASPSGEYWDRPRTVRPEETAEPGHPLVASLGRQGRDFLDLLLEATPDREEERWLAPGDDSALHALQTDLLTLRERPGLLVVPPDDRSLQLHVCHAPMREVEVLHDQLLWLFERHPDLTPADVVVMTPDIDAYAPCIEAVFGGARDRRHIPYTVADRSLRADSPLVAAFLGLLELPGGRYEADRLLALLDAPAVHRRFGFEAGELQLAQRLVRESAVRWGVDAGMRARLDLPAVPEHTWRFGLDRLLLGFSLPSDHLRLWGDIPPCDAVEGSEAQALGRLAAFVDAAAGLDRTLAAPRSMAAWAVALHEVLDRFLAPDDTEAEAADAVRRVIRALADDAARAGYDQPVSLELLRTLVQQTLEKPASRGRFLAGGVTFCAMVPMRSIPFAVVCLIGMNDGSFPRARQPLSFDRMTQAPPEPGDRSRRDDDRYLFLEAVCSARRVLFVSWVGRGVRDNAPLPPSIVVSELRAAVRRGFDAPHLETVHPLQAFDRRYFSSPAVPGLVSYSEDLCEATRQRGRARPVQRLVTRRLPAAPDEAFAVDVERLAGFFVNPTAHLLRERLGIRLADAAQPVEHREPFCLDALGAYRLRGELLRHWRASDDPARVARELRGRGLVPFGRVGEVELARERATVEDFVERVARAVGDEPLGTVPIHLVRGRLRVDGDLRDVTVDGLVAFRLTDAKASDELRLWVRHVLLHVARPRPGGWLSRWLGTKASVVFGPIEADADRLLDDLAQVYEEGLHRLLPFFPRSSMVWCAKEHHGQARAQTLARAEWEGGDFTNAERDDPYFAYAWRDVDPFEDPDFAPLATRLLRPLLASRTEYPAG